MGESQKQAQRSSIWDNKTMRWMIPLLKYGFSILITLMVFRATGGKKQLLMGMIELFMIWSVSNVLLNKVPVVGHIVHFVLLLIYNIQTLVLYFGNSYITLLMVTNLVSVEDLSGNFGTYLGFAIPMVIVLLLPMPAFRPKIKGGIWTLMCGAIALWGSGLAVMGAHLSPLVSVGVLAQSAIEYGSMRSEIEGATDANMMNYYRADLEDAREKPESLPEQPNVVLIFVEGLSQSVIEDSRGLMPNMAALEKETLFFENYYNHTFATYRGLISQLYSGYQLSDHDSNQLVSLHGILHDMGYYTTFINVEPNNEQFTKYLERMRYDNFVSDPALVSQAYSTLNYVADKTAYELLFDMIVEQHQSHQPFFTAMYSLGTHVSLDSPDEKYEGGENAELNKFYNLDCQIGKFMDKFKQSELAKDTIVVITTDHATYVDLAFNESFPDYERRNGSMDRVPLMIYYDGIEPEVYDAQCRNSVDMAPTVLDYIDVSAPNFFLGHSLFADPVESGDLVIPYDRCFFQGAMIDITGAKEDESLSRSDRKRIMQDLMAYFAVSIPTDQGLEEFDVDATISKDYSTMSLASKNTIDEGLYLWFSVYGREGGDNDIQWYRGELDEEGYWRCVVPLSQHGEKGIYIIQTYAGGPDEAPVDARKIVLKNAYVAQTPPAAES